VHYLHDVIASRDNLVVEHGLHAERILIEDGTAVGVIARDGDGNRREFLADRGVIVCCGAIDTPKLLQLSGIGPADVLEAAGIPMLVASPGVGENLMDHAEGLIVWEAGAEVPDTCATGWDAGAAVRLRDDSPARPDVLMHFPVEAVADHAIARGVAMPDRIVSIAPNVAKPHSRGRVWITSADPTSAPSIDYRYFTDADGHDEAVLIAGIRLARRIAAAAPMADWIVGEVFPGPDMQSDEELSEALRATHQTVYHVCGTCRMGADDDPMAVCDSRLRVRGVRGLRVVDASVFPTIPSVNPVGTIMAVAEHASAMLLADR
jgi:choline dehydrogenase-like flavoprotein